MKGCFSIVEGASRPLAPKAQKPRHCVTLGAGTAPLPIVEPRSPLEGLITESFPEFEGFNPQAEISVTQNRVPHWQQSSAFYFVTFRLGDSLPAELLIQWRQERAAWLLANPKPWSLEVERDYHQRFTTRIERWLDAGHGECLLRDPKLARLVGGALAFFEGERVRQVAWVVMPNHVHVLFTPCGEWTLEKLLHSWKSFTSHEMNKFLGRTGERWQVDYFNRIVRNMEHFQNLVRYIRRNPVTAKLREDEYLLWESDEAKAIE